MLQSLIVKNYIFPGTFELTLDPGMAVITGESGAGKSLLVDALAALIGKKPIPNPLPSDQPLSIKAHFNIHNSAEIQLWLKEKKLQEKDTQHCDIECHAETKSRVRFTVNEQRLTRQHLKELGAMLVDIIGQNSHHRLSHSKNHISILDSYCGHWNEVQQLGAVWKEWNEALEKIASLKEQQTEKESHLELLCYHIEELNRLMPQAGEYEKTDQEHKHWSQLENSTQTIQQAWNALYQSDEDSAYTQIAHALSQFQKISQQTPAIEAVQAQLETALSSIDEASTQMKTLLNPHEMDKETFAALERRLSDYIELARKHHIPPAELASHHTKLLEEMDRLENPQQNIEHLEKQCEQAAAQYRALAQKISEHRKKKASILMRDVTNILQSLNMPDARFLITLASDENEAQAHGIDRVEFMIQTSAEQLPLSIGKIASGGELSRVSLAIQIKASEECLGGTLVFDEVDAGIGGKTAEMMGSLLEVLSHKTQILCITHLTQIAKFAHNHFYVEKTTSPHTQIQVHKLNNTARNQEIARMLAGKKITTQTLAHAHEVLQQAQQGKISS